MKIPIGTAIHIAGIDPTSPSPCPCPYVPGLYTRKGRGDIAEGLPSGK